MGELFNHIIAFDDNCQTPLFFDWEIFNEQYKKLLSQYIENYPNATEENFKSEYLKKYKFLIKTKNNEFQFREKYLIEIENPSELIKIKLTPKELLLHFSDSIDNYLKIFFDKHNEINCELLYVGNAKDFYILISHGKINIKYMGKNCIIDINIIKLMFEIIDVCYGRYSINEKRYNTLKIDILKIYNFLSNTYEKTIKINNQKNKVSKNIEALANSVFSHDLDNFELFKYINDEFFITRRNSTPLTKYNQMYFYFNTIKKVPQEAYKNLIKEMYNFDYGTSEIKGENQNHQEIIKKISVNFKKH